MPAELTEVDLENYLDEALPVDLMASIEQRLRTEPELLRRLAEVTRRRDNGAHTVGGIWRRQRTTCPSRTEWGQFLLDVLADDVKDYMAFHLDVVGCRVCQANVDDLRQRVHDQTDHANRRRRKYFETSARHLPKK